MNSSASRETRRSDSINFAGRAVLAILLSFAAYASAWWFAAKPHPTGDEPRYLAIAFSLAEDGDFDLMNQARENKLGKLYPEFSGLTAGDYCMCANPRAPLRTPHGIGFPLILAPLLAAGLSVTGLRVALALLTALSA